MLNPFVHTNPQNGFYRPLQVMLLAVVQTLFGSNTAPVQSVQILCHLLMCWIVFLSIEYVGFSRIQAMLGSTFLVLSQINAHAVLSNDTFSHVGAALFGFISVGLLYSWCFGRDGIANRDDAPVFSKIDIRYGLSLFFFALALFSKESGVAYVLILTGMILVNRLVRGARLRGLLAAWSTIAPFVLLTLAYLLIRGQVASAQPEFGAAPYNFNLGLNILRNLAQFGFAAVVPVSTVSAFTVIKTSSLAGLLPILAGTGVFLGLTGYGLWRSLDGQKLLYAGLILSAVLALFPVFLLNEVSELYVYSSMPFVAILVGAGLGRTLELSASRRWTQALVAVAIVGLLVSHARSVQAKAALMQQNGARAAAILPQVVPFAKRVPQGGMLLLVNPPTEEVFYSVFKVRGFNILNRGTHMINRGADRPDLRILILDPSDIRYGLEPRRCLSLELDGDRVQVFRDNRDICQSLSQPG